MNREIRFFKAELRAAEGDELALVGYAALFNSESKDLGGFRELIAPGAFTRSLQENADVKCLFNHDPNLILGRTNSGTLALKQDDRGLQFRCVLDPNNTDHRNLHASIKRGDIDECSFAFTVAKGGQAWTEAKDGENAYAKRTLTDLNLLDVSAVTYPAYGGTAVVARSLFPDGEVAEIRSGIQSVKTGMPEKRDDDSYEDMISEVSSALADKFPATYEDGTPVPDGYYNSGKYWVCETHSDFVIACEWGSGSGDYFRISYHEDEANETFLFGDPQPVEKEWVPADAERAAKAVAEIRAFAASKKPAPAPTTRALSTEHTEGDCGDIECTCNNRYVDPEDVFDPDDEENAERKAARVAEQRKKGKVLTKLVDGKHLSAAQFAFVGDPEKTETWKLPIHDAAHVKDALARFDQTQGIPAADKGKVLSKIKAAAEKFGITVSNDDNARCLRACPMDEDEVRRARLRLMALEL